MGNNTNNNSNNKDNNNEAIITDIITIFQLLTSNKGNYTKERQCEEEKVQGEAAVVVAT